jgi:hypothetical protein
MRKEGSDENCCDSQEEERGQQLDLVVFSLEISPRSVIVRGSRAGFSLDWLQ